MSMTWHYGLVHRNGEYGVHEVFTDPIGWTEEPTPAVEATPANVVNTLRLMLDDIQKYPIIEEEVESSSTNFQ